MGREQFGQLWLILKLKALCPKLCMVSCSVGQKVLKLGAWITISCSVIANRQCLRTRLWKRELWSIEWAGLEGTFWGRPVYFSSSPALSSKSLKTNNCISSRWLKIIKRKDLFNWSKLHVWKCVFAGLQRFLQVTTFSPFWSLLLSLSLFSSLPYLICSGTRISLLSSEF